MPFVSAGTHFYLETIYEWMPGELVREKPEILLKWVKNPPFKIPEY